MARKGRRMSNYNERAASVKALCELKDITPEMAKQIRHIWKKATRAEILAELGDSLHHSFLDSTNYGRMLWINKLAQYHGVEYLGQNKHGEDIDYLNSGDSYTATLVFVGGRMIVNSVGDMVERNYVKVEGKSF
jgi:hypothetical protein